MNIDWLHYFVILSETKNFHSAADKIGITPPTLSKAISDLEKNYKTKLINRTHKIQGLTPEGELFLENAKNILSKIDNLKDSMEELRTGEPKGSLKIAGGATSLTYLVPPFIKNLREKYPEIHCKVFSLLPSEIEKNIMAGKIDIGFVLNPPIEKSIEYKKIADFSFIIAGKPQPEKKWNELSYIAFKFLEEQNISNVGGWPEQLERKVIITAESLSLMIQLCEQGLGAAFIPDLTIKDKIRDGLLSIIAEPPFTNSAEIYVVWPKNQSQTIIISTALKIFFELYPPLI